METNIPAIALLLGSFAGLILLRIPIAFCLGMSAVLTGIYLEVPLAMLAQGIVRGINSFSLMAIPFFILSGEIMSLGSIGIRLIRFSNACIGQVKGGSRSSIYWPRCSSGASPVRPSPTPRR